MVFIGAIPTQERQSEIPRSCVPDIDVMDPQLDPVDMDGKCVNPHKAVKEALTTKTARARACDAPKPGGPLTTRQPVEYKWTSGYPTSL